MAKVIVERPRYGSSLPTKGKGYERRLARIAWEDQPKREGIKRRSGGQKRLNEHLAPLRRYLASQVGQPWDKVFAEICRYVDRSSAVQDHLRDHVEDYVATCVGERGGQLFHGDGHWIGFPLHTRFYVCPRSGILKRNRDYYRRYSSRIRKLPIQFLDHNTAIVRMDGFWYIVAWEQVSDWRCRPEEGRPAVAWYGPQWDALLQKMLYREQAIRVYGRAIRTTAVRRAGKREVRRVVNSYPFTNVVR
jgi:hypothetical protein